MALRHAHLAGDIDFAAPSFRRRLHRTPVLSVVICTAGLAIAGWAALDLRDLAERQDAVDVQLTAVQARLDEHARSRPRSPRLAMGALEADEINATIARLNLPWANLFDSLEAATPARVALLELTPDAKQRILTGVAEAAGSDDMLAYLTQLGGQPFLSAVMLSRHEISQADSNKPVRFQFTAKWGEASK